MKKFLLGYSRPMQMKKSLLGTLWKTNPLGRCIHFEACLQSKGSETQLSPQFGLPGFRSVNKEWSQNKFHPVSSYIHHHHLYHQKSKSYISFSSSIFCSWCILDVFFFFFFLKFFCLLTSWGAYNLWRYICSDGNLTSSNLFLFLLFLRLIPFTTSY